MNSHEIASVTWAVVPLKSPGNAKSRLASVLNDLHRRMVFYSMAEHVIETLRSSAGIARVCVVTSSDEVERFARRLGTLVIRQGDDRGTAAACVAAVRYLRHTPVERLLMISGDLPLLSSAAVQELLATGDVARSIVLAPDRRRQGTNALLCAPPQAIPPVFGKQSFLRHQKLAKRSGVACHTVERLEFALDVDVAADLECLSALNGSLSKPTICMARVLSLSQPRRRRSASFGGAALET